MCIIILLHDKNKLGKNPDITRDTLKQCWTSNRDGAGYSFIDTDEKGIPFVMIKKGFFKFKNFYRSFERDREKYVNTKFMIHMRYATKGALSEDNCHPFLINNNLAMAHNGTFSTFKTEESKGKSDSCLFAEFISGLPEDWYKNNSYKVLVHSFVGKRNRVSIMCPDNNILIFNKSDWIQDGSVWYSNDYYKKERKVYSPVTQVTQRPFNPVVLGNCSKCGKTGYIIENETTYCIICYEKYVNKFAEAKQTNMFDKIDDQTRCKICGSKLDADENKDETGCCDFCLSKEYERYNGCDNVYGGYGI